MGTASGARTPPDPTAVRATDPAPRAPEARPVRGAAPAPIPSLRDTPAGGKALFQRLDERYSGLSVLLVAADLLAVAAALAVIGPGPGAMNVAGAALLLSGRATARLYRRRQRLSYIDEVPREFATLAAVLGLAVGAALVAGAEDGVVRDLVVFVLLVAAFGMVPRAAVFEAARIARVRFSRGDKTLLVGHGAVGVDLAREMLAHPEFGLRPVGFVPAARRGTRGPGPGDPADPGGVPLPVPVLDGELPELIVRHRVGTVVLAFPDVPDVLSVDSAMLARRLGCNVMIVPRMFELYHDAPDIERIRSYPLVRLSSDPTQRPAWWVKRAVDVLCATVGLVVLSPVLLVAAVAIVIESGRPVLFCQERVGLDGRTFRLYKLRSLRPESDEEQRTLWSVAHDRRVGHVGRFLRRTSLDELPQLWNIVRGEMSVVGPRPERPAFVERFTADHERYWARHRVPSGLTGLAQVNGLRGDTSIADRVRHDNYYIANWSLWLDVKIILLTFRELLRRGSH